MRVLGVDPGSRFTGYGCIESTGNQIRVLTHGTLKLSNGSGKSKIPFEDRLLLIFQGLSKIILDNKPDVMAIEKVFFAKNPLSALKLGQARGVALLTGRVHSLAIAEYNPTEVKRAIVGHGYADKGQVARVLQWVTGNQKFDTDDASDGLALALCHIQLSGRFSSSVVSAQQTQRNLR